MKRIALLLVLPMLAFSKDSWSSGTIKVLDTNEWCARPGIPDWPGVCGPLRSDTTALFNNAGTGRPASPLSQILEIDTADAIYVIRRTSMDSGLQFSPGAKAQFQVDGKHMLIKFDREATNHRGETSVHHDHDRTDILETKKR